MPLTYSEYLQVDKLLDLQVPKSEPAEHDETLFIIIHQVFELWFKQMKHEFGKVHGDLSAGRTYDAIHTFKRLRTIVKTLVEQMDVLETMTPMSFSSFRDRLETASGFQSVQYREFEFVLGYRRANMLQYHVPEVQKLLQQRLEERSTYDHFYDYLKTRGCVIPTELAERDLTEPTRADERIQTELLRLFHSDPEAVGLFELMTDFDEGVQEWRYRHTMLVLRTIGDKKGTGGSLGVEFLKKSLFKPAFPDLWAIRSEL